MKSQILSFMAVSLGIALLHGTARADIIYDSPEEISWVTHFWESEAARDSGDPPAQIFSETFDAYLHDFGYGFITDWWYVYQLDPESGDYNAMANSSDLTWPIEAPSMVMWMWDVYDEYDGDWKEYDTEYSKIVVTGSGWVNVLTGTFNGSTGDLLIDEQEQRSFTSLAYYESLAGTYFETTLTHVPEPSTALLLSAGLVALAAAGRRRSLH